MSAVPHSVLLAGGGTAGHVSPLLAVADCLRRRSDDVQITALGTREGLEARLVPARGYELAPIPRVPLPRKPSTALLRLPGRLADAIRAADDALVRSGAQVVVGFGGYVASPAYLAARRRGIPIVVHEQNARPGVANRLGARLSRHVGVTFPDTALPHAVVTGMPLRREITTLDRAALRAPARAAFGLAQDRPTVLVTGGSLGAQRLNEAFQASIVELAASGVQVLHVAGTGKEFDVPTLPPGSAPYVVVPYVDAMERAYAAADLVVARSGANTVCELTAVGLPAIYVPLPIGNGEQRLNARHVVAAGGGLLVEDAAVDSTWVREHLIPLALNPIKIQQMSDAAASVGQRGGDELVVDLICDAAASAGATGSE